MNKIAGFLFVFVVAATATPVSSQILQWEGVAVSTVNAGTPGNPWIVVQPTTAYSYQILDTAYQQVRTFTLPIPGYATNCVINGASPDFDTDSNVEVLYAYLDTTTYRYSVFLRDIITSTNQLTFSDPDTSYYAYTLYFGNERVIVVSGMCAANSRTHSYLYRSNNPQNITEQTSDCKNLNLSLENRPNPALGTTRIDYELKSSGRTTVSIYDVSGRKLKTLLDAFQPAGNHSLLWDGTDDLNNLLPSGAYFSVVQLAGNTVARKIVMLR